MSIFIGSTPTIQEDDVNLANNILKYGPSSNISQLVEEFSKVIGSSSLLFTNKGRDSIYLALKTFGVKEGDDVLIQAFTCIAVVAPILWLKAKPVYMDIELETFCINFEELKRKITENTKVIIVQHTFGNIVNLKDIRELINNLNKTRDINHQIKIIEDCAHILPSDFSNTQIGKHSDAQIYSFAQDKSITSIQGGLLIFSNTDDYEIALNHYREFPLQSNSQARYNANYILAWNNIKEKYFKPVIKGVERITWGKFRILLYRFFGIIKKQASDNIESNVNCRTMSDVQATLLLNQLPKLNIFNKKRSVLKNTYDEGLNEEFRYKGKEQTLLRYPVMLENPSKVLMKMSKEHIIGGRWYSSIVFPFSKNLQRLKYFKDTCPNAEFASKHILNLPLNIDMTEVDCKTIIDIVNKYGVAIKLR